MVLLPLVLLIVPRLLLMPLPLSTMFLLNRLVA